LNSGGAGIRMAPPGEPEPEVRFCFCFGRGDYSLGGVCFLCVNDVCVCVEMVAWEFIW
jgi:hypothetical protein